VLRSHLEAAYANELDGWVRRSTLPGLNWHLQLRDHPPAGEPLRPGRPVLFARDPDGVVRLLRELLLGALERDLVPPEPLPPLHVGTPAGSDRTAAHPATTHTAMQALVETLITADGVRAALASLPLDAAMRDVIGDYTAEGGNADDLVDALGVLSRGASMLALLRRVPTGDSMLVDPVEVAEQAEVGTGEFVCGWWPIRDRLAEPARGWVELLEGRFPRARAQ